MRRILPFVMIAVFGVATALAAEDPEQLMKAGHHNRAWPLVEAALKQNPNDSHALVMMARLKRTSGDLDGSCSFAERAIAADTKNADAHFELADCYGEKAGKMSIFKAMGMATNFKKELNATLAINPNYWQAHWAWMQFYLQAPGFAGGSRDKAQAEQQLVAKINPVQGFLAQTEIAAHDKQNDKIPELYRKAREAAPNDIVAITPACRDAANKKQWAEAETCSAQLVKLDPERVGGYILQAHTYASQNKWADLDRVIAEAEKRVPDNLSPYFQAGSVLATSGADNARGERYLRKYLSQPPELGAAKHSRAHWRLGQILEKEGRKADAIQEYQIAVQQEPTFEPAQKDLKRLR